MVCQDIGVFVVIGTQSKLHYRVRSHAPSIQSHRGTKVVCPDFQPMRVPEEPVCFDLFRQNPVFTSLHLKSPVHVHRLGIAQKNSVYSIVNIFVIIIVNVKKTRSFYLIRRVILICSQHCLVKQIRAPS
jgi:hypothetical protein